MDEQQTSQSNETKGCGCSCEFCAASNHAQCQSGVCTMKDKPLDSGGMPKEG